MRVGVMGAGAVGCFVGGRLAAAGVDVVLVGRPRLFKDIQTHGLTVADETGRATVPAQALTLATSAEALQGCDVILVCTKSRQTERVGEEMKPHLAPEALVVSLQNGVRNPGRLRQTLPQDVLPGIVEFNVVWGDNAHFQRTTRGPLVIEAHPSAVSLALGQALASAGLDTARPEDAAPLQWTKLVVNANNAISALTSAPTAELMTTDHRFTVAAVVQEAIEVLEGAQMPTARFRGVPIRWMPRLLRGPIALVRFMARAQLAAAPEARSSMWQDLKRRRPTEIDDLNGVFVELANQHGLKAPLNARLVKMIRAAEKAEAGPELRTPAELRDALGL